MTRAVFWAVWTHFLEVRLGRSLVAIDHPATQVQCDIVPMDWVPIAGIVLFSKCCLDWQGTLGVAAWRF
jgi:hypothetical protein